MHILCGENSLLVIRSLTCTVTLFLFDLYSVAFVNFFFLIFSPDGTPPSFLMKCALGKCMYSHIKYFVILIYLRFLFQG